MLKKKKNLKVRLWIIGESFKFMPNTRFTETHNYAQACFPSKKITLRLL